MRGSSSWRAVWVLAAAVVFGSLAGTSGAAVVFYADFENPVVVGYDQNPPNPAGWVAGAQGFGGGSHGLDNKNGGDFTAPFGNDQAYAFRYTNSGLTTAAGVIGALEADVTYVISFDVVMDGVSVFGSAPLDYSVQFIAFADGAVRNDCRSTPSGSALLTSKSGDATSDGTWTTVTFTYRTNSTNADLGKDLAVRLKGASDSATIDNVQVTSKAIFWDTNGATAGAGGSAPSGTWSAADANWSTSASGDVATGLWSPGYTAFFGAGGDATGSYNVTVDGTQEIDGLTFEEGSVTLSNGTDAGLRLTANTTVTTGTAATATVQPPLSEDATGGRELIKSGHGTLTLSGDNSYTGLTTVNAGKLILSGDNAAATGGITVKGGAAQFESPASINGTGNNVTVNRGGAVVFGPSFGDANIPAALSGRIVASSAGTIAADNYAATDLDFNALGFTDAYLGAVDNVTYTGTFTPNGTTYRLGGGGGTLTMADANAVTGSGHTLTVGGDVVLAASNDYDGVTTVTRNGILSVSSLANAGQESPIGKYGSAGAGGLVLNDGTFQYTGSTATVDRGFTLSGGYGGGIDVSSPGATLTLGECSLGAYKLAVTGGAGSRLALGAVTLTGNATLNPTTADLTVASITKDASNRNTTLAGTSADSRVTGVIALGTGTLTKTGSGTWTLSGDNTYTGVTTVSGGTLSVSSLANSGVASNIGKYGSAGAAGLVLSGGRLRYTGETISVNRGFTLSGNSTIDVNSDGVALGLGACSMGAFTLTVTGGADSSLSLGAVTLTDAATLNPTGTTLTVASFGGAKALTLSGTTTGNSVTGVIGTGGGTVTKSGAGTWTLYSANTYTGTTTISGGTLVLSGAGTLGSGNNALTMSGGTLDLGGTTNRTVGLLTISGAPASGDAITNGSLKGTSYAGTNTSGNAIVSANLLANGSAGLTKTGGGTLTLSGTNTYTGATTITAGTVSVAADENLGDANPLIFDGGTLRVTGTALTTYAAGMIGSHAVTQNAGKTIGLNISNAGNTFTVSEVLAQGTGGFTKAGAGTVVLNQDNTYTGTTTVNAGILRATTYATALGGGALALAGGELQLAGESGSDLSFGRNTTLSGNAQITSDLTASGAGNTYTFGNLALAGNTLTVAKGANVTSGTAGITFNGQLSFGTTGNSVIDVGEGVNMTVTGVAIKNDNVLFTKRGLGTLTLVAAGAGTTRQGPATLEAGTMRVEGSGSVLNVLDNNQQTLNFNGGTFSVGFGAGGTINGTNMVVGGNGTVESDTYAPGSGVTYTFGTLNMKAAGYTLNVKGGANVDSGTAEAKFGNTTLSGNAVFNITNPVVGGTTRLTVGAITGNANRITLTGNGDFAQTGVWSGTGSSLVLDATYSGTATLSQTNTFTGPVSVKGGTLKVATVNNVSANGPLGNSALAVILGDAGSTGTLQYTGGNATSTKPFTLASGGIGAFQVDTAATNLTLSGAIDGGGLAKTGPGKLTLSTAKTYTGDTIVSAGTLSINSAFLADAADVYLTTGAIFNLNFTGEDTIAKLFFDGVAQAAGTWGSSTSTADNKSDFFSGGGILLVTVSGVISGDTNEDGIVDAADFITLKKNFGTPSGAGVSQGNFTGDDGAVNWADLNVLTNNFGAGGGAPAVTPEPATLGLLMVGALAVLRRRRK